MEKMKALYEKVAEDSALQMKFAEIMKDAEKTGVEATKEKLIAFAKEAGYDVSPEELAAFFRDLANQEKGELSEEEMDAVAGGKVGQFQISVNIYIYEACGSNDPIY